MTDPYVPGQPGRDSRAAVLDIVARIHAGRGTAPYRVISDAEAYLEWLRTGVLNPPTPCTCSMTDLPNPGRRQPQ